MTMGESSTKQEAEALWSDAIDYLKGQNLPASRLAMLEGCVPLSFEDDALLVSASRFVKLQLEKDLIPLEAALSAVAFQPVALSFESSSAVQDINLHTAIPASALETPPIKTQSSPKTSSRSLENNPLYEPITEEDSKLTFERFVRGDENIIAYEAAKQVAEGINRNYNPLFIYGRSGVGKTHLLKAVQNYIVHNEPWRFCVYRVANDFIKDYTSALSSPDRSHMEELEEAYREVDVLIIDDIQHLKGASSTITFFFNTFNYLREHGKQIVLAADESPMSLGMGDKAFEERMTSRFDSGFSCPIQVPDFELKRALVTTFYNQMKEDAQKENIPGYHGNISEDGLNLMAERSGSNIRVIRSLCQACLLEATKKEAQGEAFSNEDIIVLASGKFTSSQRIVTIEQVQKAVENEYQISHSSLVGNKRTKEIMEPRHAAIWLARELTDNTLETIGTKFGGRTHATVKNSIRWIDDLMKENRLFYDKINRLKDEIAEE